MTMDVTFRTDADHVPGVLAAQRVLGHRAAGDMGRALTHLDIGIDEAGAREYLERPLKALMSGTMENPDWVMERMLTIAVGFAVVAVMAERERVRLEEPPPTATMSVSGDPTPENDDEQPSELPERRVQPIEF